MGNLRRCRLSIDDVMLVLRASGPCSRILLVRPPLRALRPSVLPTCPGVPVRWTPTEQTRLRSEYTPSSRPGKDKSQASLIKSYPDIDSEHLPSNPQCLPLGHPSGCSNRPYSTMRRARGWLRLHIWSLWRINKRYCTMVDAARDVRVRRPATAGFNGLWWLRQRDQRASTTTCTQVKRAPYELRGTHSTRDHNRNQDHVDTSLASYESSLLRRPETTTRVSISLDEFGTRPFANGEGTSRVWLERLDRQGAERQILGESSTIQRSKPGAWSLE